MRHSTPSLLAALASGASALNIVQFDIARGPGNTRNPLSRRASSYTETLINNVTGGGYYAQVSVGTPGQPLSLILDTGSSDAWVVSYQADLCTDESLQEYYGDSCSEVYNPTKSSTYAMVERNGFDIEYLDGSKARGDYITDDFAIGGATVKSLQLGYVDETVSGTGILGVGFVANEATTTTYPNLITQFQKQGLIGTEAYSLYLDDYNAASGTILFGGVDTEKFIGPLEVLPIQKESGFRSYTAFQVEMGGVVAKFGNGSTVGGKSSGISAILDSGTTLSYLPDDMARSLFKGLNTYTDSVSTGLTFISCDYLTASDTFHLEYTFGSTTVAVPVNQVVLDVLSGYESSLPRSMPFSNPCLFGIQTTGGGFLRQGSRRVPVLHNGPQRRSAAEPRASTDDNTALLGDTFLRSAYVVYDLTNAQVGLAQANINAGTSNVKELGSSDSLSAFTGVAAQQTTATATGGSAPTPTASGGGGGGGGSGGGGSGTGSGSNPTGTNGPKNSARSLRAPPATDALAVVLVSSLFALFGGALFVL